MFQDKKNVETWHLLIFDDKRVRTGMRLGSSMNVNMFNFDTVTSKPINRCGCLTLSLCYLLRVPCNLEDMR